MASLASPCINFYFQYLSFTIPIRFRGIQAQKTSPFDEIVKLNDIFPFIYMVAMHLYWLLRKILVAKEI